MDRMGKVEHIVQKRSLTIIACRLLSFLMVISTSEALATDFAGQLKSVSIKDSADTNQPPVAQFGYSVTSSSPLTVQFDAGSSVDADGSIFDYRWDFGDGSKGTGQAVSHSYADPYGSYAVILTAIDDKGAMALSQQQVKNPVHLFVNFQPADASVPNGFVLDAGTPFETSKGFGWASPPRPSDTTADRNSSFAPSQEYDTLVIYVPTSLWEAAVPPGQYSVTVCVGDASWPDGVQYVQVEGQPLISGLALSTQNRWIEKTIDTTVSDGRLSLSFVGAYTRGQIDWVKIQSK